MISKTKLKVRLKRKTNPELEETIALALKNPEWISISKILSGSTRAQSKINLGDIESQTKVGDTVLVPGKVLSLGEITKKIRIAALGISAQAKEKLSKTKSEFISIKSEIQKNPKAQGVTLIR
tara:strand:- start:13070 stop:13438 length:369 start_codon:yes stop_codon:yes gene_type:complete